MIFNKPNKKEKRGELIVRSQKKFPKRRPDNGRPVIIRIDGSNLLLMIRKMRSSRPHFKYIFHYGGADKQHCRFQKQSPFFLFAVSVSQLKYDVTVSRRTTSHFGDAWIVPNWKHLFPSWEVNFKPCHKTVIAMRFILCFLGHGIITAADFVSPSPPPPSLALPQNVPPSVS